MKNTDKEILTALSHLPAIRRHIIELTGRVIIESSSMEREKQKKLMIDEILTELKSSDLIMGVK